MKHTIILLALFLTACDSGKTSSGSSQQHKPIDSHISVVTSEALDQKMTCESFSNWCRFSDGDNCLAVKVSAIESARVEAFHAQYCAAPSKANLIGMWPPTSGNIKAVKPPFAFLGNNSGG
jgi:hypothetical protein